MICKWFRRRRERDAVNDDRPVDDEQPVDEPIADPDPAPDPVPVRGVVLYDPGHTSHRVTNRSPPFDDGHVMYEFATVRQIGEHAVAGWERRGYRVIDTAPPVDGPEDFDHRIAVANAATQQAAADGLPVWFFSFHTNAVGGFPPVWRPDARGIEVFHFPTNERGEAAAVILARSIEDATGWPLRWRNGAKGANFKVLRSTTAPANLIEFGFHTNPTEAAYLRSDEGQKKLAAAVVQATDVIFSTILNPLSPAFIPDDSSSLPA